MSAAQVIESTLESNGLEYRNKGEGRYFVTLPGNKKLQTSCWLILTEHALLLEAFVCRQPDKRTKRYTVTCCSGTPSSMAFITRWTATATSTWSAGSGCTR